jgi:RNA polymerase sigma-70 factor, ECF subfamily
MSDAADIVSDRERLRDTLIAVAGGDRPAFETLYRLTSAKLFGVCLRILGKRSDAEDVLQETYTAIWHKAGLYDAERASPITWLVMVARNKAIDRVRAESTEPPAAPIELAADVGDATMQPGAAAEARDSGRRLDHCLGQLEPRQRTLIRTAFFEGVTYENLAARGGVPLGTVKSWIRRGLLKLKACLEP